MPPTRTRRGTAAAGAWARRHGPERRMLPEAEAALRQTRTELEAAQKALAEAECADPVHA